MALAQILPRRGTSAQWIASNPVLANGEIGYDSTVKRMKIGDGNTVWSGLAWATTDAATISKLADVADQIKGATGANDAVMTATFADESSAFRRVLDGTVGSAVGASLAAAGNSEYRFDQLPIPTMETVSINTRTYAQDPIVTAPNGDIYTVFFSHNRRAHIARLSAISKSWEVFDLSRVAGSPFRTPTGNDAHNSLVIARDGDGYLHVMGDHHDTPILRYMVSKNPDDITSWTPVDGSAYPLMTYPMLVPSGPNLLFFYRLGVSGAGDWYLRKYVTSSKTWSAPVMVFGGRTAEPDVCAYPNRIVRDSAGRLHVFYMWRKTDGAANDDFAYVRSDDDGATWQTITGSSVTLPIMPTTTPPKFRTGYMAYLNQSGAAVDAAGRPHAIVRKQHDTTFELLHFHHNGNSWVEASVLTAPRPTIGRPSLVSTRDGRVYAAYRRGQRAKMMRVFPTTGPEFDLFGHDLGASEAGWEMSFDTEAARKSDTLRCFINPTVGVTALSAPPGAGTYGGVLTVDLSEKNLSALQAGVRSVPYPLSTLAVADAPTTAPDNPFNTIPLQGPTGASSWFTVGGPRLTSGVALLPPGRMHASKVRFGNAGTIRQAAVSVVTAGDAGSTVELFIADATGPFPILAKSPALAAVSVGTKQGALVADVVPGKDYYLGVIVRGGTAGVGLTLAASVDPRVGGNTANAVFTNTMAGWRTLLTVPETAVVIAQDIESSPFAPIVAVSTSAA